MSADTRDPQFRIYRRLFLGIHVAVAVIFCLMLAVGVVRGVSEVRPEKKQAPEGVEACVESAARQRQELLQRLASFPTAPSAAEEGKAFERWSVDYRARLMDARARCLPPAGATGEQAKAVKEAFDAVVRTLDLSAITATHWARHLGPSLDEATEKIERARTAR